MTSGSDGESVTLSRRYATALRERLALKTATSSRPAAILGREALAAGLDAMDLVGIHGRALLALRSPSASSGTHDGAARHATAFLLKTLGPIERAHRAAMRSNGNLKLTRELADTHRQLTRELGRRQAVTEALETSKCHHAELLEKSARQQEHLRRLSREILSAHEEERKRISRELHDEIGQTLTAINVKLATLQREATVNTKGMRKKIASTQRLVERSMNTVHRFARELRPPLLDDLGLIPALHSHMKDFTKRTHIPVHFTVSSGLQPLEASKRTVLYRVAQEALSNVARHAHASLVKVSVRNLRGNVQMDIHDNGRSFDSKRTLAATSFRRLGLLGMRERVEMVGGTFTVESSPEMGTTIRAQIPLGDRRRVAREPVE